ncbi:sodium/solute symporter [Corynebacterium poyangense]|uniref:Sodium/solute symporter n=1 Tax=Corynebacterium poyangense TaxID=2684405 RepID=A0A7H0SLQ7_9CORY|nr:sodium:solute symporter [Corynebacterium poyangense]MBZ8177587.1 sodium/solute symporter [Corynebacterium poyangense]QNQ89482.1 sodium/solute symporter [Corynebacterium poyangense]
MAPQGFGTFNWIVVIVYLLAMLGVGLWFAQRAGRSQDDYFKAGGRIPAWAAGFSIYATTLSAITFMSTPEKAFLTDWAYAAGNLAIFAIVPILIGYYVPFFRKLDVTTAYEYLEERFGPSLRIIGSLLFVFYHLGRIAIVIYLPTLALTSVTDINPMLVAAAVGILCVIYTFLGGMEGVIWSDVIQGIILLGGAATIVVWAMAITPDGFSTAISHAAAEGKFFSAQNLSMSNLAAAMPIIFIGSALNSLHQYTASQDVVQRYQTTPSVEATKRSLIVNGILALITIPLFYGMGTALYNYYNAHGGLPEGVNTSAVVPYFIVTTLPAGMAGLLVGAIFAAAQSTISSSLNSISACVVVDLRNRFMPHRGEASVMFSRVVIIVAGAFSVAAALYLVATDKSDLWDLFLAMTGLFGVPLAGVFALGIFTTRATTPGVTAGLILGAFAAWEAGQLKAGPFLVSIAAFVVAIVGGYLCSLLLRGHHDPERVIPLTIRGRDAAYERRRS